MVALFRLLAVLVRARLSPRAGVLDESRLDLRVWPGDLDLNLHVNNGRYLTVMDLGRIEVVARCGLGREMMRRGWRPAVGAAVVRFRRPIAPFARYRLRTRVVGWDAKWFYFEQRFEVGGETAAIAAVKGLVRGRQGAVPPAEALAAAGAPERASPDLPAWVALWERADALLGEEARRPRAADGAAG